MKAANLTKVKGDGTTPKSILRKGTPIANKTTAPKTTATPTKGPKGRSANNNDAKSGKQKLKGK